MHILLTNAITGKKVCLSADLVLHAHYDNESLNARTKVMTGIMTPNGTMGMIVSETPEEIGRLVNAAKGCTTPLELLGWSKTD